MFKAIKNGEYVQIEIAEGDIIKIYPNGNIEQSRFEYSYYYGKKWWDYGIFPNNDSIVKNEDYINDLKTIASYQGFSPETIDTLMQLGYEPEEIEEYIYHEF